MRRLMMLSSMVILSFVLNAIPARGADVFFFTTIDVPGTSVTILHGINNAGQIVGVYGGVTGVHGFLRSPAGHYTSIDYPDADATVAYGINNLGQIVGFYTNSDPFSEHGFLFLAGSLTTLDYGATEIRAEGINDVGQIVGSFAPFDHPWRGFLLASGTVRPIDNGYVTEAHGINKIGQIVGGYQDGTGTHGFVRSAAGTYTSITYAGAFNTTAYGINDVGWIVGWYTGTDYRSHGFLRDAQGRFTLIDYPGATSTFALGINTPNRKGHYSIVGSYRDTTGTDHGFVATPCGRFCNPLF